jgi:hypothetical protein
MLGAGRPGHRRPWGSDRQATSTGPAPASGGGSARFALDVAVGGVGWRIGSVCARRCCGRRARQRRRPGGANPKPDPSPSAPRGLSTPRCSRQSPRSSCACQEAAAPHSLRVFPGVIRQKHDAAAEAPARERLRQPAPPARAELPPRTELPPTDRAAAHAPSRRPRRAAAQPELPPSPARPGRAAPTYRAAAQVEPPPTPSRRPRRAAAHAPSRPRSSRRPRRAAAHAEPRSPARQAMASRAGSLRQPPACTPIAAPTTYVTAAAEPPSNTWRTLA